MNKKRVVIVVIILCVFLISLLGLSIYFNSKLSIILNGNQEISLSVNSNYDELGCNAYYNDNDISKDVKIFGSVDTNKIGTYKIKYKISRLFVNKSINRIINIGDNEKPSISLKGDLHPVLLVNEEYNDMGVTVKDNYDTTLENNIIVEGSVDTSKIGDYEIKYTVKDSSNNESSITRNVSIINSKDDLENNKLPVLMYHFFYDKSKGETGADGNFTEVSAFEEQVKYLVDNNYYFPKWEEINDYMDGKAILPSKSIVLTFDDGSPTFFNEAYPILKKYNVKGTSFIITSWFSNVDDYDRNIIQFESHSHNMHRGGCVGGHGGIFQCLDEPTALDDLKKSKEISNDAIVFCYPFGDVTDNEINLVKKAGYKLAFTTKSGKISPELDKYQLPRVRISGGIDLNTFIKNIS